MIKLFVKLSQIFALAVILIVALCRHVVGAEPGVTGAEIYRNLCVKCHGPNGEGVADKHDEPLNGDRSVESLAKLISRTMPEDIPEKCTAEDSAKVARYIYDAFYSPQARARNNPPKIQLSRLTVRQYQNSVADLIGSFRSGEKLGEKRGLIGQYYNARNFRNDKKVFDRVDSRIEFNFGDVTPDPEKLTTNEFAIQWHGSVITEETGNYEFILKTENGARLWVNNEAKALIDAWVSSGSDVKEYRETIFLLGGRAYPIHIDYFKFKEKTASLVLQWRPPHGVYEAIPERNLAPVRAAETLVVAVPFPPDDSSVGYERGTAVSKAWDQAATSAAIDVANKIVEQLEVLAGAEASATDREERLKRFCEQLAAKAFRRPLSDEQKRFFVEAQFEGSKDLENAVKRGVLLILKSPRFLYPQIGAVAPDDYDVASRLSFGLWDSLPDQELLEAAAQGKLHTHAQVGAQAQRMLNDARTKSKLRYFFHHWLKMDEAEDVSKDTTAFPDFNETILSDLRTSLDVFVDHVVWSESSDYRQLLLADYVFLNQRLAKFYGVESAQKTTATARLTVKPGPELERASANLPDEESAANRTGDAAAEEQAQQATHHPHSEANAFQKVSLNPKERAGVLTHPYLLSAFAYYKSSSPIHRGVFLTRNIVGRALKPPPMAIQFMDGRFKPNLTMREKVTELTSPTACQSCHSMINPLGFSLEHFDAVGRWRASENQKPIDSTSEYATIDGDVIRLTGARDLAGYAVGNEHAHRGFISQLFEQIVKQPAAAYGPGTLEDLRRSFTASEFNIQKLIVEIVKISALHGIKEAKP